MSIAPAAANSAAEVSLNAEQVTAAAAPAASVLVLAGPGTGKTTTLVARYRNLVAAGAAPARLFVATFTVKAADELRRRIAARTDLGDDPRFRRMPIGTLHGMAARLLLRQPPPGCPHFQIFDERACGRLVARHRLYLSDETMRPLDVFAAYKDRLMGPAAAMAEAERSGEPGRIEAARKYALYQAALAEEGGFDFGDLIMHLVLGMEADAAYRARIAGYFDHLLIDEYQDINLAQERMIRLLRDQGAHLWAVGDDDQCLYAWRSADPAYILGFEQAWPAAEVHRLVRNYRSTATIVDAAGALIRRNRKRHAKELRPENPSRLALTVAGLGDGEDEAAFVLRVVKGLAARGAPWGETAVLYRTGHVGSRIQIALAAAGVPVTVRGAGEFWQLAPVRLTAGLIRLMKDHNDHDARAMMGHGKRVDRLLATGPDKVDRGQAWAGYCTAVGRLVSATLRPPGEEGVQWRDLCFTTAEIAAECDGPQAFAALMEEQRIALRRAGASGDAVVLSTIHGAKGLEWTTVVVAGCEADIMPHESSDDLEEERRLMYVAATRARRYLVLTFARHRRKAGLPSPYIAEMLSGVEPEQVRFNDADTESLFRPRPAPQQKKKARKRRPSS